MHIDANLETEPYTQTEHFPHPVWMCTYKNISHENSLVLYEAEEFPELRYVACGRWYTFLQGPYQSAELWAYRNGWSTPEQPLQGVYMIEEPWRFVQLCITKNGQLVDTPHQVAVGLGFADPAKSLLERFGMVSNLSLNARPPLDID